MGLYHYKTENPWICDKVEVTDVDNKDKIPVNYFSMLQTVKEKKYLLTRRDIVAVDKSGNYH